MNTKEDSTGAQANWFVGASYGGTDDQMPRFLAEGIWENGYDDKFLDVVRSMRPGERHQVVLHAKARFTTAMRTLMTPYDKLKSLPQAESYLKPGASFEILDQLAYQISDNEATDQLQKARQRPFKTIHGPTPKTPADRAFFTTTLQTNLWIGKYLISPCR